MLTSMNILVQGYEEVALAVGHAIRQKSFDGVARMLIL